MIYYDLTELYLISRGTHRFYGIARVVAELAFEIARLRPETMFVVHDESRRRFLRVAPRFGDDGNGNLVSLGLRDEDVPFALVGSRPDDPTIKRAAAALANTALRLLNRRRKPFETIDPKDGVLFCAGRPKPMARMLADLPESSRRTLRFVPLLHDAIPLHGTRNGRLGATARGFRDDTATVIAAADLVLMNSAHTARDVARFAAQGALPVPSRSDILPLAHECREEDGGEAPDFGRPYILGVGLTPGRKNMEIVLRAQERMLSDGLQPPLLVVTGVVKKHMVRRLSQGGFPTFPAHVAMIGSVSQARLIRLYKGATATVMASRLEGWGLPLGESLWLGTPALSSRLSSLPEVGGDLALYFDADDPAELAGHLARLLQEPGYAAALRERIAARAGLRSWRQVAGDLLDALDRVEPQRRRCSSQASMYFQNTVRA